MITVSDLVPGKRYFIRTCGHTYKLYYLFPVTEGRYTMYRFSFSPPGTYIPLFGGRFFVACKSKFRILGVCE